MYVVIPCRSKFAPSVTWPHFGHREWKIVFGRITLWYIVHLTALNSVAEPAK